MIWFIGLMAAASAGLFMLTVYRAGSIGGAIRHYRKTRAHRDLAILIVIALVGGFLATSAKAEWLESTSIYAGLERPWDGNSQYCEKGGPDDRIASNLGIRQHLYSPVENVSISAQWTHHSCAIGDDSPPYDALGLTVEWRIDWD